MIAIDVPHARRLALGVVLGQAVVTVIVALLSWALVDPAAALSAVLGGGISTAASLAMVLLSFGRTARMVLGTRYSGSSSARQSSSPW